MKIVFYAADKPREQSLARAFAKGAERVGHTVTIRPTSWFGFSTDLACMVGVKSRVIYEEMQRASVPVMMFDKGYSRHKLGSCWEYWRVSYKEQHPTDTTLTQYDYNPDRFNKLKLKVKQWRKKGNHILILGSSAKYHNFHKLADPTTYTKFVVKELQRYTDREIIYRPKPSWRDSGPVKGSTFSVGKNTFEQDLRNCHAVVTHGSNGCYEAALHGVPSIVLGNAVMKSVSSTRLEDVENPLTGERRPIFNGLGYHQWTLDEFSSGQAFETMEKWF